jgi:hypothetical protein
MNTVGQFVEKLWIFNFNKQFLDLMKILKKSTWSAIPGAIWKSTDHIEMSKSPNSNHKFKT